MRPFLCSVFFGVSLACASAPVPTPWRQSFLDAGRMRRVEVSGGALAVIDVGEGPAVILLHGLGGSAYDWREAIGPLTEAGFRVVIPDMLGVAYSDHPADVDYCMVAQARRIGEMADAMGIAEARVAGNSYGGGVAVALAVDRPALVERLALISPAVVEQTPPLYVGVARVALVGDLAWSLSCKHCVVRDVLTRAWGPEGAPSAEVISEYAHEQRFRGQRATSMRIARMIDHEEALEALERMGEIRAPVLVLWGTADAITPPEGAQVVAERIPHADVRLLEGEGHVPHMARPERVLPAIVEFLYQ